MEHLSNESENLHWEKGYYVGQEFIEDSESTEVIIQYNVLFPVIYDNFHFNIEGIKVSQNGGIIEVKIGIVISKLLFNRIKSGSADNSYLFILGYINKSLSILNNKLLSKKYEEGHVLSHSISTFDIMNLVLIDQNNNDLAQVSWPSAMVSFPPTIEHVKSEDTIFLRDLLDAMTNYFNYNTDDCIRKIITSLENCFIHYKMSVPKNRLSALLPFIFKKSKKFKKIINCYVTTENYPFASKHVAMFRKNIMFIYHLRNLIVHDKLRIDSENRDICKKAIGTLLYIYQGKFSQNQFQYSFSLMQQFLMIDNVYNGINLDNMRKMHENTTDAKPIHNDEEMDNFMFSGLAITDEEKKKILVGLNN